MADTTNQQEVSAFAMSQRSRASARPSYRLALLIQIASVILDIIVIIFAFWAAYQLRYEYRIGAIVPVSDDTLGLWQWSRHALAAIITTVTIFIARGVYRVGVRRSLGDYVPLVTMSFGTAIAVVILFAFFIQFSPSRAVYIYVLAIGTALMLGHRALSTFIKARLFERGVGVDSALIVGESESARRLAQTILGQPRWGYRLVGFVSNNDLEQLNVATEAGIRATPRLGGTADVNTLTQQWHIDEVFIVEEDHSHETISRMIESCRSQGVEFQVVPELLQISLDRVDISEINGVPLMGVRDASISGWQAVLKRGSDIVTSSILLILLGIPALIIAWAIRRDSTGSVFYRQQRIGQNGHPFMMVKFRTMVTTADSLRDAVVERSGADVRLYKDKDDPRITGVGRWLRKYSIDELPQIWNVFKGDMTFVGPRPPLPREVAEYQPWHQQRLLVRPGMTGLWQVSGRSELTFDQMVRLDLYYAENWSLWLDIKIVLRTIPAVIFGRGAY
ncbi:MAG: sugar transferase [Thermomicrobiales bacterium]|nr:sugar transferase [Thermomicrobiales bacterium]